MTALPAAQSGGGGRVLLYAEGTREWAALLVDGRLEDILTEDACCYPGPRPGTVCAARVDRISTGGRSAFVNLGDGQTGFLPRAAGLAPGDSITVQIDRFRQGSKAARVTQAISLPGRLLIRVAGREEVRISRRISDPEARARLQDILVPHATEARIVVRTAALTASEEELVAEADMLAARYDEIRQDGATGEARELLAAPGPVQQGLTTWCAEEPVASMGVGSRLEEAAGDLLPEGMQRAADEGELLAISDLDAQLRSLGTARIELGGGAWMMIEPTEALVAIDVNTGTGELAGTSRAEASLRAAQEIPRQLRLRGLGGMVVVDFPHGTEAEDDAIERALKEALHQDGGRAFGWTAAGNYELVRSRDRRPLGESFPADSAT